MATFDDVLEEAGALGRCQKRIFALLGVLQLTFAGFLAGIVFQGYTPDHWCRDSAVVDMRRACGWSLEHTRSLTVPLSNTSGRLQPSKCTRFDVDWNTTTLGCDTETLNLTGVPLSACKEGWEFDYEGRRTFVTEVRGEGHQLVVALAEKHFEPLLLSQFNLVCSDSWLVDMFQSIFGVGRLVSSLTVGYFADTYGRKVSIIMTTLLNCMGGISMAVVPSYICILILRAVIGFGTKGSFTSCYVLQSPRWLVSQKKFSKAYEITNAMATENKRNISKNLEALVEDEGDSPSGSILDLFRTPNMRKYTLILMFNWFTSEVVYQGLIMRVGITAKNLYIDFLIPALVEIPAALLIFFTIERMGRRLPFASSNFIAGLSCLITAFIPDRVISLMGGALVLLLPETKGVPLPDTIDDVEFPDRRACGWSLEHTRSLTVPLSNTSGRLQPSKCTRFDVDWNTTTLGCDTETLNLTGVPLSACKEGWEFDYEGRRTFVTEFNLVCSDSWLVDMFQSIFGVGRLVGSLTFGYFSDIISVLCLCRYGRKVSIIMSTLLNCMAGISMAVVPSYICILIFRAVIGFVTEIVGVDQRRFVGIIYQMFYSISFLIIPLLAYFITDWRWLQAAFCLPSIIFVCYYWFIPESPRWLVSQKKFSKAYEITNAMATENKRNISKNLEALVEDEGDSPSGSILDLFRTPNMRKYTLILMFNWFTSEVVYQGLIMRVGITAKNLYIDFLIPALVEIPAALLIFFTIERMGRRLPFASSNFIAGLSCLITAFIPDSMHWAKTVVGSIGRLGVVMAVEMVVFVNVELYPTFVRSHLTHGRSFSAAAA
uniref:Solute carrier family 22 member 2 n=1 Tax=Tetraodon nigroviridis TaxID=99883 RepID=H3BX29_TETNG